MTSIGKLRTKSNAPAAAPLRGSGTAALSAVRFGEGRHLLYQPVTRRPGAARSLDSLGIRKW